MLFVCVVDVRSLCLLVYAPLLHEGGHAARAILLGLCVMYARADSTLSIC